MSESVYWPVATHVQHFASAAAALASALLDRDRSASTSCCKSSRSRSAVLSFASHPVDLAFCAVKRAVAVRVSCSSLRSARFEASATSKFKFAWESRFKESVSHL